ncbi:MAG TPA: methylated-DNA--[protein]-cysteine S-methyltransferase [Acidimicrobiia bacterium]|jgi:methylated-DNA-[protein]-cysteine S-methyltransferase|nr:methylated-DNA--[protein]-cysteine S-methyltransferase [Acidimicrobiia bacterium]
MATETAIITFPLGSFRAGIRDGVVHAGRFESVCLPERQDGAGVYDALSRYFAGDRDALDDIFVEPDDGTPFQRAVWRELRRIPAGTTISYAELARRVGRPSASRAVGMANAANPVALIVPCHRVIRTGGALGGYAYGLTYKRWLLDHEANVLAITS